MLFRYRIDHDVRGVQIEARRSILRGIAIANRMPVRQVISFLRSGEHVRAGWYRYIWVEE
jgi:hypothetical protein